MTDQAGAETGPPRNARPYDNVMQTIGWTPLIRLHRVAEGIRTPVYGKAEFMNPGGSLKDRIGPAIIDAAEREGRLRPGGTVVEGTSGNTGVGLATAAALARDGGRVYIACRDSARGGAAVAAIKESTGSDAVSVLPLDLSSLNSVRACA
ncbi:MAG: pyridoxal-phosphate dependent enzyme, partial [Gemmatimonadetes bacterium]|nr:pyridoxal-phosphate dependent enzyme [Gemmatimonadota bacterium]